MRRAGRIRRALAGIGAVLGAALTVPAGGSPAQAFVGNLPAGRSTYVMALMDGVPGKLSVRLATYHFLTNGQVLEEYWAWRQDAISGRNNTRWTKVPSGTSTSTCRRKCPVRTPVGFQRGRRAHQYTGQWNMYGSDKLVIRWPSGAPTEVWNLDADVPGMVGASLQTSSPHRSGWGVGSLHGATGIPLATAYQAGWVHGPFAENAYATTTRHTLSGLNPGEYTLCGNGTCMQGANNVGGDRRSWYHSYLAADPSLDGRKVFWNNQTGVVQQMETPSSTCISTGGGHTNAMLQAIDDSGRFVGYVGVEASLGQRKVGQAVVAAYAMLTPAALEALHW